MFPETFFAAITALASSVKETPLIWSEKEEKKASV